MSSIYCHVESCKYRSKRRSRTKNKGGEWLHKCTKDTLVMIPHIDGEYESDDNTITCVNYKRIGS